MIQLNLDNLSGQLETQMTRLNSDKTWFFYIFLINSKNIKLIYEYFASRIFFL